MLAAQFPLVSGDGHARAGVHSDEIGLELGEGGEDVEEHLADGIVWVVEGPAQGQFHASFLELAGDGAGIRYGSGQAVEFGHDQGVALTHGGQGLAVGGTAGVSDEGCGRGRCDHGGSVRIGSRICNCHRTIHMRRSRLGRGGVGGDGLRCPLGDGQTSHTIDITIIYDEAEMDESFIFFIYNEEGAELDGLPNENASLLVDVTILDDN